VEAAPSPQGVTLILRPLLAAAVVALPRRVMKEAPLVVPSVTVS